MNDQVWWCNDCKKVFITQGIAIKCNICNKFDIEFESTPIWNAISRKIPLAETYLEFASLQDGMS